ncbi:hypothetical protein ABW19_dt0201986 [Dactylella cylindrospora]|nr:hypothetical protein ABW19_dt0201986 [Dactylella cylindrospora]
MAYNPGQSNILTPPESLPDHAGGSDQQEDPSKLSGFFKNISFGNRTTKATELCSL